MNPSPGEQPQLKSWESRIWRAVGAMSVAVGIVNAFIPLLPTTVFLLIGVWAYGKGDPRLRQRLLDHPRYGPSLKRWVEHRQISTRGKIAACLGIAISMVFTAWMVGAKPVTWLVDGGLAILILYLITRPGVPADPHTPT